jgi:peptidoglycan/xylan/chitin deacetylase (PgdA/CDA1 family)
MSFSMPADDRSLGLQSAGLALAATGIAYLLPALAGPRATASRGLSSARLRRVLGVEDSTADGVGCALTFDDGPHPAGTPAVLAALAAAGAKATFFLVGEQVRSNPALAREILAEGHWIGLHCDRHRNLLRLPPEAVRRDIAMAEAAIGEATGRAPLLYRPPYGVLNAAALRIAGQRAWRTLLWSHWGLDWEARATPESIADLISTDLQPGSVLLLHDADDYGASGSWRNTAAALPRILERVGEAGLALTAP